MKKLVLFSFFVLAFLLYSSECGAWWFSKSHSQLLAEAVKSENPKKVDKCLNKQIEIKNFPGILKIRHHARTMIRQEQNKRNTSRGITPDELKKNVAPWMGIEKKATEFYKVNVK